uniref:Uncharacterized protein n=1 Tax=Arundo donax TaxID=35708 RepID=A0A0A8XT74_ARUDO
MKMCELSNLVFLNFSTALALCRSVSRV